MATPSTDAFETLFNLQQVLETFRASRWLEASPSGAGSYPPVNVFEKGDDLVLIAEAPGVKKADLELQVKGNTIRIAGKKSINYSDNASAHRRERVAGRFDRAVTLPIQIDPDGVKAECRDGLLSIFLPRAERDKPKSITVS